MKEGINGSVYSAYPESRATHILDMFEQQVALFGDKTAIIFHNHKITYRELEQRSNQWARMLLQNKLNDSCVGISLNRTESVPEIILGILKAGSHYVFIDPRYPDERKQYILEDAGIAMMITSRKIHDIGFSPVIYIEDSPLGRISPDRMDASIQNDSLAYIMYTSGSTGRPKGVEITTGNVSCYIAAFMKVIKPVPADIHLHTASFSFSSSVRQYLLPLTSGGTLVIADEDQSRSLHALLELIRKEGITMVDSTPSFWKFGLSQIDGLPVAVREKITHTTIRSLVFSGDMLPAQLITRIRHTLKPWPSIFNVYAETETIGAFAFAIPSDYRQEDGTIPIGYPLPGFKFLVLDEGFNQVGPGQVGELFVSSDSLGNGYHNKPELTSEVFRSGELAGQLFRKVVRMGDLVRYWTDRPVEIIGRRDFQIKIRGVRIDPAEIESVAREVSFVKEALVVPFQNSNDEQAIAAFIVPKSGYDADMHLVRNQIKAKLPGAYLPEKIILTEQLPLNPNGKIDRKALQSLAHANADEAGTVTVITFRNEIEKSLYNLFSRVLNIKDFGLHDSFFDLGGHSLKAVELTDIMESLYNKKIPLDMIYRNSSISELAGRIESLEQHDEQSNLIPIKPEGSGIPFVCVHGDDANFFIPKYLSEQIPFYGYFHQGRNGERIRNTGIDSIAAKYVDELLKVRPTGPYIIGGYSIGGVIAQAMIPLIRGKGQEVILLVLIDTESPEYRGSRITGRKVFNDAEVTLAGPEHISPAKRNNFCNRIVNSLKIRWFDFSYYIGLFFAVLSIKIPLSLRNSYIMGTYRRARRTFRPQPVHINTLLFRSTINNLDTYDLGWGRYLTGKFKIIETETDHNKIIKEPYIRHISAVLSCEISSMP